MGVGGWCREFLNHECSMARSPHEHKGSCATSPTGPGGLTGYQILIRIPLWSLIRILSLVYYNNSRVLGIKKGERVIIIKAHLDGVGRGEWGEAHILAHKAGYVCVTYTHASRTCVCVEMCI